MQKNLAFPTFENLQLLNDRIAKCYFFTPPAKKNTWVYHVKVIESVLAIWFDLNFKSIGTYSNQIPKNKSNHKAS